MLPPHAINICQLHMRFECSHVTVHIMQVCSDHHKLLIVDTLLATLSNVNLVN